MSRCFPYPPPGFYRNGATYDALIESIKLQKETNKSKGEQKKEKKRKKEKKEKSHKHKRTKAISELLENSDLTEEHGQPISSQQPSYSSDSTQNSNKRKRDDYSLLADNSPGHGSFKIRFLKPILQSSINEILMPANDGPQKGDLQKAGPTRLEKKMLKKHVKYEKLIGTWLPPVFQAYRTDDDWLLSCSKTETSNSLITNYEGETCRELVACWQPCARFLAEVDIHALPYTVPF